MAKRRYEAEYVVNLNKTLTALQKAKEQAAEFDDLMSSIGDRGNLNSLIDYFLKLDTVVDELRTSTDSLMAELGDSLKGGYISSLDGVFGKLADISNKTQAMLSNIGTLNLADSNAPEQLEQMARQVNDIFKAFNLNKKIDIKTFLSKPLEEQRARIAQQLKLLNKDINTTLGNINIGNIQGEFKAAFDGAEQPFEDLTDEVKAEINELEKESQRFGHILDNFKKMAKNQTVKIDFELSEENIKAAIDRFNKAQDAFALTAMSNDLESPEYYAALFERSEAALVLQEIGDKMIDSDQDIPSYFLPFSRGDNEKYALAMEDLEELSEDAQELAKIQKVLTAKKEEIDKSISDLSQGASSKSGQSLTQHTDAITAAGKHVVDTTEYINGMRSALDRLFAVMSKPMETEYKILMNGQDMNIHKGQFEETGTKTLAETYLSNLDKNAIVSAHSHQGKSSATNHYDFRNAMSEYYSGISKISAIIGQNDITTLNLAGVALEDAEQALAQIEARVKKVGAIDAKGINNIFKAINPQYNNIAQLWKPGQFDDLTQFIYQVGSASDNALAPVEKFQNIIKMFAKGIDLSKYQGLLDNFSQDQAATIFNQIMSAEKVTDSDGKLLQVQDLHKGTLIDVTHEVEKQQLEYLKLRRKADITYKDITNAAQQYVDKNPAGVDFFKKYFHVSEMPDIDQLFEQVEFNERDMTGATNAIGAYFGLDPEDMPQLQNQADLLSRINDEKREGATLDDDDEAETIRQETGTLEEKLAVLKEISDQYGVNISQRERNRLEELTDKDSESGLNSSDQERFAELSKTIEEADANLLEFEQTYERIVLTLANGKKLEILPNDTGLRNLYKIGDEGYGTSYNGVDIQDVQFVRTTQDADTSANTATIRQQGDALEKTGQDAQVAAAALKAFNDVINEINNKRIREDLGDDMEVGKLVGRLEAAKQVVDELGEQGKITAKELKEVEGFFSSAQSVLNEQVQYNRSHALDGYVSEDNWKAAQKDIDQLYGDNEVLKASLRLLERENAEAQELLATEKAARSEAEAARAEAEAQLAVEREVGASSVERIFQTEILLDKEKEKTAELERQNKLLKESAALSNSMESKGYNAYEDVLGRATYEFKSLAQDIIETGAKDIGRDGISALMARLDTQHSQVRQILDAEENPDEAYMELERQYNDAYKVFAAARKKFEVEDEFRSLHEKGTLTSDQEELDDIIKRRNELVIMASQERLFNNEDLMTHQLITEELSRRLDLKKKNKALEDELSIERSMSQELADRAINAEDKLNQQKEQNTALEQELELKKHLNAELKEGQIIADASDEVQDTKKLITSYEELCTVVQRYNQLAEKDAGIRTADEIAELDALAARLAASKTAQGTPNVLTEDALQYSHPVALEALAQHLGIEIPAAADKAEQAIKEVTNASRNLDAAEIDDTDVIERETAAFRRQGDVIDENTASQREFNAAQDASESLTTTTGLAKTTGDIANEVAQYGRLLEVLRQVKAAADLKTDAFREEGAVVESVVRKEIAALAELLKALGYIKLAVDSIKGEAAGGTGAQKLLGDGSGTSSSFTIKDSGYALEGTLQKSNTILGNILAAIKSENKGANKQGFSDQFDTGIASASVLAKAQSLGSEVQLKGYKQLANGLVQFEGVVKNSEGVWKGFVANVNKSNQAVQIAEKAQSAYANALNKSTNETQEAITAQQQQNVQQQQQTSKRKKATYGAQAVITARATYNSVEDMTQKYVEAGSIPVTDKLDAYKIALDALIDKQREFNNVDVVSEDDQIQFKELQKECRKYARELDQLVESSEKLLNKSKEWHLVDTTMYDMTTATGRGEALKDYVNNLGDAVVSVGSLNDASTELTYTIKNEDGSISEMKASLDATRIAIASTTASTKQATSMFGSFFNELKGKSKQIFTYMSARMGIDELFQQVRKGIQYVREIDKALTELKKVTDETETSYATFLDTMSQTAGKVGSTVADLTTMAAEWARLKYLGLLYSDI